MNHEFRKKHKILFFALFIASAAFVSSDREEHTRIHIEFANMFVAEYEKNISQK